MADSQEERQKRDEQIRETIMAKLIETGIYVMLLRLYIAITDDHLSTHTLLQVRKIS